MESLEKIVFAFIKENACSQKPVLLGLSGGPDSLSLFYLLLLYREHHSQPFGVAHINHNWRKESGEEAEILKVLAEKHNVPFHLKSLDPSLLKGNLEAACREERLAFFDALSQQFGYQAVLLGHHADDQSETFLKRLFEGQPLETLQGMKPISKTGQLICWRPLLTLPKKQIVAWLEQNDLIAFYDSTNDDTRFLRSRMRNVLIPQLSNTFGKEIGLPLMRLAGESAELESFLEQMAQPYLNDLMLTPYGICFNAKSCVNHPYLLRFILRKILREQSISPSYQSLQRICELLCEGKANKSVTLGSKTVQVDRGWLFVMKSSPQLLQEALFISGTGSYIFGDWEVLVESRREGNVTSWTDAMNGLAVVSVPALPLSLEIANPSESYPGKTSLSKWWGDHKVPAFMRNWLPVIKNNGTIVGEFLSGRCLNLNDTYQVTLILKAV